MRSKGQMGTSDEKGRAEGEKGQNRRTTRSRLEMIDSNRAMML